MIEQEPGPGGRRETRLLLATIAVSVGVLLLLARFRFPDEATRLASGPAPAPLERLAARATYDELAGVMADLERKVLPSIVALATQGDEGIRYVPAVRVSPDRAVALVPLDRRLTSTSTAPVPPIVLRDSTTELVVVQTPSQPDGVAGIPSTVARPGPRYLAVAEATGSATAVRPVYVGRTDLFLDPRWPDALMSVAAVQQTLSRGSAVFSLDGTFLGLATDIGGQVTIIPSSTLRSAATGTLAAPTARADLPFEVQPLTPSLARAAGADRGVMVSHVAPSASTDLSSGDVIQSIDGTAVSTVAGLQQIAQSRTPGAPVTLQVVRRGRPLTTTIVASQAGAEPRAVSQDGGLVMRAVAGVGSEVITIEPGSAADRAGLRRGDLIVTIDGAVRPDPDSIIRAQRVARPGHSLLLTIRRDGEHRMIALEKR